MALHAWRSTLATGALVAGLVVTAALDAVLNTRLAKRLDLYVFPVMQLLYPASFVAVGVPTLALLWWTGHAIGTPTPLRRVARVVGIVAVFDSLASVLVLAPALYLSGDLLLLLGQASLPFTLLASLVYLRTRYGRTHFLAVGTVLAAVAVDLLPAFLADPAPEAGPAPPLGTVIVAVVLAVGAHLPASASRVYQDYWLKTYDLHPWTLLAAVAPVQLAISFVLLVVAALAPLPAPAPALTPAELGPFIANGTRCVLGTVAALPPVGAANATAGGLAVVDCTGIGTLFGVHLAVNVAFNLCAVALIKRASANLSVLVSVLRIGVSAVLFAWPLAAGVAYDALTPTAVLALVIAALGVATYRSVPEQRPVDCVVLDDDDEIELTALEDSRDDMELSSDESYGDGDAPDDLIVFPVVPERPTRLYPHR